MTMLLTFNTYPWRFALSCTGLLMALLLSFTAEAVDVGWPQYGNTAKEQRFSELDQINTNTVAELDLAWYFETDFNRGLEGTPIVVDGVIYFTGNWSVVYAVDARSGELLWRYDPKVPREWAKMACCDVVNRGVAVADGKVVFGTLDTRLVALDQATGELLWETRTANIGKWPYTITGAPRIAKGKVFIGNGGAEYGVRGYVSAYDLDSGELAWRFYTVPGDPDDGFENAAMAKAAETWNGQWWKFGGGGTVWDSIVYDEELDQLYIGVGNGSPWDREKRSPGGGDNLYLSSIVALNPDSGEYIWHYQTTPAETWDYTATQHIMLADVEWQGEMRKVIWQAPKNGFFFVIDRHDGELLSAEPYVRVNWASGYDLATGRPNKLDNADYSDGAKMVYPSAMGGHNWHPMAHSPATGLVYVPILDMGMMYKKMPDQEYQWGHWNHSVDIDSWLPSSTEFTKLLNLRVPKASLLAWDPVAQEAAWHVPRKFGWNGGVLATAGDLVFQGTGAGRLTAVHAASGEELWSYDTQVGVVAPPISYELDGEQYIAVLAGYGGVLALVGGYDVPNPAPRGRLLTFKLGGAETLPPLAEPVGFQPLPERPDSSAETLELGRKTYHSYCYMCHGNALISSHSVPDLRNLPMVFYDNWDNIVLNGMMAKAGMVGFADVIGEEESQAIYEYVIDAAYRQREEAEDSWWNRIKLWFYRLGTEIFNLYDRLASKISLPVPSH